MKNRFVFVFMIMTLMAVFFTETVTAETSQKKKTVNLQFQYRKSLTFDDYPIYELYLYNSKTDELTECLFFGNDNEPGFEKSKNGMPYFFWWCGGGGYEVVVEKVDSSIVLRKIGMDEGNEETRAEGIDPFYDAGKTVICKLGADEKINVLPPKELKKPKFTHDLKIVKPHAYGDDIRYLQFLLCACHNQIIDIDGYFGRQTEEAVKNVQAKLKLEQTGIVDSALWKRITDTSQYEIFNFCF